MKRTERTYQYTEYRCTGDDTSKKPCPVSGTIPKECPFKCGTTCGHGEAETTNSNSSLDIFTEEKKGE
jgi:hypothetical protein